MPRENGYKCLSISWRRFSSVILPAIDAGCHLVKIAGGTVQETDKHIVISARCVVLERELDWLRRRSRRQLPQSLWTRAFPVTLSTGVRCHGSTHRRKSSRSSRVIFSMAESLSMSDSAAFSAQAARSARVASIRFKYSVTFEKHFPIPIQYATHAIGQLRSLHSSRPAPSWQGDLCAPPDPFHRIPGAEKPRLSSGRS